MTAQLLPFAQLDVPGQPALAKGRYLVRPPGEPETTPDVLAISLLGAEPRAPRGLGRRRVSRPAEETEPAPIPLGRLTLIKASIPFESEQAAAAWLETVGSEAELARGLIAELARTVNRALLAQRVATRDPYAADVDPSRASAQRLGYGTGEQLVGGEWSAAATLSARARRSPRAAAVDAVGAQERIAAVLGGREEVPAPAALLDAAELALREDRLTLATLQLAAAAEALADRGADLGATRRSTNELRGSALTGAPVDPADLEQALRSLRRAAGEAGDR